MNDSRSISEFTAGLQNIEREIISKVRQAGGTISASNFRWHRGKNWIPIPDAIELQVQLGGREFNARLGRDQVEDSWQHLERPEVRACVRDCVGTLTRKP